MTMLQREHRSMLQVKICIYSGTALLVAIKRMNVFEHFYKEVHVCSIFVFITPGPCRVQTVKSWLYSRTLQTV